MDTQNILDPNLPDPEKDPEARKWGMYCHLSALLGYILVSTWIIWPFLVWILKKDDYDFVDDQGRESLNFQITIIVCAALAVSISCIPFVGFFLCILVEGIIFITNIVLPIMACKAAGRGEYYRYPVSFRLLK